MIEIIKHLTTKRKYVYSYDSIEIVYSFLEKTTEKYFSKPLMTTTEIIRFFPIKQLWSF